MSGSKNISIKLILIGTALLAVCWLAAYITGGNAYALSVLALQEFELLSLSVPFGYIAVIVGIVFGLHAMYQSIRKHLTNRSTPDAQKARAR